MSRQQRVTETESRRVRQGGDEDKSLDDREDGPFIVFLNPKLALSLAAKEKLRSANIRFLCFSEMCDVTDLLSKSTRTRRFIVTVSEGLGELSSIIDGIDDQVAITYIVILGQQDGSVETLADLIRRDKPD